MTNKIRMAKIAVEMGGKQFLRKIATYSITITAKIYLQNRKNYVNLEIRCYKRFVCCYSERRFLN